MLTLPFFDNVIAIRHTFLDFERDLRIIINESAAPTSITFRCHSLALALALIAMSLHLHLHAESDLDILHDDASSVTFWASLELAVLGARAFALVTVNVPVYIQGPTSSQVQVLQGYVDVRTSIWTFLSCWLASIITKR